MNPRIETTYHRRRIVCEVTGQGELDLWLDRSLRKRRPISAKGRAYVWTSIELDWEMHHLIEGKFDRDGAGLSLYIRGELVTSAEVSSLRRRNSRLQIRSHSPH